ncbi:hypothetical protein [Oceanobacillus jeddahense]|uniref:hypothetical protein n=1 Tax=Oceanobacillus jeddahense TaxID=1462527 RepID=UPI0011DD02FA|nr:hypothetical protein [Oceanobacillus jeddahense]
MNEFIQRINIKNLTVERKKPMPGIDILVVSEDGRISVMVPTKFVLNKSFENIYKNVKIEIEQC